jgi:hypothetical protein
MKTIGFFGDSFCSNISNDHSIHHGYETYIEKISKKQNLDVIHLGIGGSSVWDCVLLQFQKQIKIQIPDICVFAWTESHRLFHREYRNLNAISIENSNLKKKDIEVYHAALNYFQYFYDREKHDLEYVSLLHYFDKQILSNYKDRKFIHMWTFNDSMMYRWENGVEIRPPLIKLISRSSDDLPIQDNAANHLRGENKNNLVYNTILDAINNYQNGKLITFDTAGIDND